MKVGTKAGKLLNNMENTSIIESDIKCYLNSISKNKEYIIEVKNSSKLIGRIQTEEISEDEAVKYSELVSISPNMARSIIYAKSLIDKLEASHPEIAHKLMGVDEMIEMESIIEKLNKIK